MKLKTIVPLTILFACLVALPEIGLAQAKKPTPAGSTADKPNILVIFGDDIGQTNVSAYSMGMMGYKTPNIDRVAKEGMTFTDYYAEQSCTAGRSSFITGQCTLRTGLSKVGVPGSPIGLQDRDVTMAQLLKSQGYATGQFGKNHLGDLNKYLPTVHGFDEYFGNLYHLNAEEEPERRTYPQDPKFKEMFGPRGVFRCKATDTDDPTEQPRWGRIGKQTIEDSGPLTKKRMETIDDETSDAAVDYITRQAKANKPFFCWMNTTRMHAFTHVKAEHRDKPGFTSRTEYNDGMIEHDVQVGKILNDGYNQLPYLTEQLEKSPRRGFFYFNDDGDIVAVRVENWKIVFLEQRVPGTLAVWGEPFTPLRLPKMYDLHADPYEQADITSNTYYGWELEQGYILLAGSTLTGEFLKTFKDFPPSQRPATFTIDQAMEKLKKGLGD